MFRCLTAMSTPAKALVELDALGVEPPAKVSTEMIEPGVIASGFLRAKRCRKCVLEGVSKDLLALSNTEKGPLSVVVVVDDVAFDPKVTELENG